MNQNNLQLLDGKIAREALKFILAKNIQTLHKQPKLVIIFVGEDAASQIYVRNKVLFGASCEVLAQVISFRETVSQEEIIAKIKLLNVDPSVQGIIVQAPLPQHLNFAEIVEYVVKEKDVDGLVIGSPCVSATARGIMSLLDFYDIEIVGKRVVVVGRSNLVGEPVAAQFLKQNATVTICHTHTKDLTHHTKDAEILIVATGYPHTIGKEHVSPGQIVIDVGIHRTEGGLIGDVDFEAVKDIVSAISPVPGGVGPMTVLSLFQNLYDAALLQSQ